MGLGEEQESDWRAGLVSSAGEEKTEGEEVVSPGIHARRLSEVPTEGGPSDLTTGKSFVLVSNLGGTQWGKTIHSSRFERE